MKKINDASEIKISPRLKIKEHLTPARIFVYGFLCIILFGAIMFVLPISSKSGKSMGFINALFMATTSVCVTGLAVIDPSTQMTIFGQIIMLLLIQIGGLGFMTSTTFMFLLIGKKISLRERLVLQENLSQDSLKGVVKFTKKILIFTFVTEGIGAIILCGTFIPIYGPLKGIYVSIFTAVSAFCNAGLDILGSEFGAFSSLSELYSSTLLLLPMAMLIIVGGIGFLVFSEIYNKKRNKRISLHARIVLIMTISLLSLGTIVYFIAEYNNPLTLGKMTFGEKIVNAFFQSTTTRTAGFSTFDQNNLTDGSKLFTVLLMFIGASPASTGGGVKTTTLFMLFIIMISTFKNNNELIVNKEKINEKIGFKVITIVMFALFVILSQTMILWAAENGQNDNEFMGYIFESVSAFATVGLSTGITPTLSIISKLTLCITMFIGRLGPLTLGMAVLQKSHDNGVKIIYPEAKILIG